MLGVPQEEGTVPRVVRWRAIWVTSAAALAVLLVTGLGVRIYSERSGWESVSTAIGNYRRLPLADGSTLEWNTASEVRYRLTEQIRELDLAAGEARFRVAHDTRRPFVVSAGDTVVRAVGTEFTVRIRERRNVDVVVAEGVVAVTRRVRDGRVRELLFGQQVPPLEGGTAVEEHHMLTDEGGRLGIAGMIQRDIEAHDAWRTNLLIFDEMPLQQVAAEFNRYNRRKIEIDNETIGRVPISGRYKTSDIDGFLARLGTMMAIRVVDEEEAGARVLRVQGVREQGISR